MKIVFFFELHRHTFQIPNLNYASVFMSYCYVPECCNPRDVSFTEGARLRHFECVINLSRNLLFVFDSSTVM